MEEMETILPHLIPSKITKEKKVEVTCNFPCSGCLYSLFGLILFSSLATLLVSLLGVQCVPCLGTSVLPL